MHLRVTNLHLYLWLLNFYQKPFFESMFYLFISISKLTKQNSKFQMFLKFRVKTLKYFANIAILPNKILLYFSKIFILWTIFVSHMEHSKCNWLDSETNYHEGK